MSVNGPEYPGFSAPCNGCGYCCAYEACQIAVDQMGADPTRPCPALESDGARFRCGLIRKPSRYIGTPEFGDQMLSAMIADALGAGRGCDADPPEAWEMPLAMPPAPPSPSSTGDKR